MGSEDTLGSLIADFRTGWVVILIMSAVVIIITLIYVFLLRWIAKPLIYISIIIIHLAMAGGIYYLVSRALVETDPD